MRGVSAIPVLKAETVTCNLPDRLVIVGCSLSGEKEVLVEETLFVPLKLDDATGHHKQSSLALGCLFCELKKNTRIMLQKKPECHNLSLM